MKRLAELPFALAAEEWLLQHRRYISARTISDYRQYIKALTHFFGMTLNEIHIGHVREYQDWRLRSAGATRINQELCTLQQIMKEAEIWYKVAELYQPLPVPRTRVGRPLTAEQELLFDQACVAKKKWLLAGHSLLIMKNTTCGFGELRMLQRRDVDLRERLIRIHDGAKNTFRERTIPLNDTALDSMLWILSRWERLGGQHPHDLILPHRAYKLGGSPDFTKPMGSIKGAFAKIKKAAKLPDELRIYDMRPHAITKLLSNPRVSPQTAREIAGHISQAMQDRYSHQLLDTKREALEALEIAKKPTASTAEIKIIKKSS